MYNHHRYYLTMVMVLSLLFLAALFFSCSTEIESTNPFDPESPKELQRKGGIKGKVVLENVSDISDVKVNISVKDTGFTTITDEKGQFTLTEIPQGRYTLRVMPDDVGYRETEVGNIEVSIGKTVDLGNISVFMKKGTIRGLVKKTRLDGKKEAAGFINVYVLSKGNLSGAVPAVPVAGGDRCEGKGEMRGAYSGVTNGDGTFEINGIKAGSRYVVNPVDKLLGMGYSGEVEIKEDGEIKDVGEVEIIEPSALVQVKDEEGKGMISVTNKGRVMLSYQMAGIVQDVKVAEGDNLEGVEWKMISGGGSDVINLSEGEGNKVFSVKFRDIFCRESPVYQTSVYRDITQPELVGYDASKIDIDGVIIGKDGRSYVRGGSIKLKLNVYDAYHEYIKDTSGMWVRYGEGDISGNNYEGYNREKDLLLSKGEGEKEIRVQIRDAAGNESMEYKRVVVVDNKAPKGVISISDINIEGNEKWVSKNLVDVKLMANDEINGDGSAGSGVDSMRCWNGGDSEPAEWKAYVENIRWDVSGGDGDKEIRCRVKDVAGNESDIISYGFKLITKGTISGKVYLEGASDHSGVNINLTGTAHTAISGVDGSYEIKDIGDGIYEIVFTKPGYKKVSKPIGVKAYYGADGGVVNLMKARGYIYGNVQLEGTINNSGAIITLMPGGYAGYSLSDGSYRVENIPIGSYTVEIYKDGYSKYSKSGVEVKEDTGTEMENVLLKLINMKVVIEDKSGGNPFNTKYTKSKVVDVWITPPDKYGKVCVAEEKDYDLKCKPEDAGNSNYIVFNPVNYENFTLSDGDGEKRVYVRFLDETNTTPLDLMEGVTILDTVAPDVTRVVINGGSKHINKDNNTGEISVSISGLDITSGVYQYAYRFEGGTYSPYKDFVSNFIVNYEPAGVDGEKRIYIKMRDFAGNESNDLDLDATASIIVDTVEPLGTGISIKEDAKDVNNVKYVKNQMITVQITKGDAVRMRLSESTDFENSIDINISGINEVSYILSPSNGTKTVYAKFYDEAGNGSLLPKSDSVVFDNIAPSGVGVVINNNAKYTTGINVGVKLKAKDAVRYALREDTAFIDSDWIDFVPDANNEMLVNYTLSTQEGDKVLYAKFKDFVGNESVTRSDSIILDNVKPTPLSLEIYESTCTTPIQYTNNTSVCIRLTADDNVFYGTDLFVAFGNSNSLSCASANYIYDFSGCTETPCIKTFNWTLPSNSGYKYVSACVKDKAGNYSGYSISNGVMLDTVPPSTPANIAVTPKSRAAIVSWTASSDYTGSGIKNYIVEYNSGGGWTSLNVNGDTTTATITGLTNGLNYTFRVKAVDYAGNQSGYNTVYNVLIGIARANITVPENISARIYSPTVSYIDGDLFIAGPGVLKDFSGSTLELYKCPVDTKDCKDDDNWEKTALNIGMLWSVFNKTKVITDGSYYYIPAVMANSCIPTCSYTINFFRCSRSNDCMNAANWNNYNIEPSTPTKLNTDSNPMITDGKRLYFAYFYGNTPRIASCSLYSDCTNSANWSKVDLSVAGDTSNDTTYLLLQMTQGYGWHILVQNPVGILHLI